MMSSFDLHAIKRILTSQSGVRVEKKGQDPKEIKISGPSVACANNLPTFFPPTDTAFTSRLVILPFESIFYLDEEVKNDLIEQGIPEERLHPARSHSEIMADVEEEKAGILKMLIDDYIDLRDNYNLRPVESKPSKQLKAHYREINDLVAQFVKDCLVLDDDKFITNDRLEELWKDFSGQSRPKMKKVRDEIEERWPEVTRDVKSIDGKTKRGLFGLSEKDTENTILQKSSFLYPENEKRKKTVINTKSNEICNSVIDEGDDTLPF